jgi:hypothetical protein
MITSVLNKVTNEIQRSKLKKLAIIFLFLFSGCSSSDKNKELVFLENVMIREGGLYVLMGSKPMSTFPVEDCGFPESEEEIKLAYELYLSESMVGNLKESPVSYDEFAEDCRDSIHLHYRELWNASRERLKDYVGPRYRFVLRKNPFGEQRRGGLFINVPNTLHALKHYYQEFAEVYGGPFEPEKVLNEISNDESPFWTCVFRSNYTQGLIFGYGRENSHEFDWQMKNKLSLPRLEIEGQSLEPLMKKNIKVPDLRLPSISVYSVADEKLKKYRQERKLIFKELKGKDFEQTVKTWLSKGID